MKKKLCVTMFTMMLACFFGGVSTNAAASTDRTISVTDAVYGATGDVDYSDDTRAFQQALNEAKTTSGNLTVTVPAGTYYISDCLFLYSNTSLILDDNATIVRLDDSKAMLAGTNVDTSIGGYDALVNVTVSGGRWDGNVTRNQDGNGTELSNLFYFCHATNLTIKDLTLEDCCGWHHLELAGVKSCTVENVTFKDFVRYAELDYSPIDDVLSDSGENMEEIVEEAGATYLSEALQIDYAGEENSAGAAPFDGTVCRDIVVRNCSFENCLGGIGNHHSEKAMTNIQILNNRFSNLDAFCLDLPNMTDVVVKENTAVNVNGFANISEKSSVEMDKNVATYDSNRKYGKLNMIICFDSSLTATENTFTGAGMNGVYASNSTLVLKGKNNISLCERAAVRAVDNSEFTISGTIISNTKGAGISIEASEGTIKENSLTNIGTEAIQVMKQSQGSIIGNTVNGATGVGITVDASTVKVEQNKIGETLIGIFAINSSSRLTIADNTIQSTVQHGIYAENAKLALSRNTVDGAQYAGIRLVKGTDAQIKDNVVTNSKATGISVDSGIAVVYHNTVNTAGGDGIQLTSVESGSVENNTVSKISASGISVSFAKTGVSVKNNTVKESTEKGIFIYASKGCVISGNSVYNSAGNGIHLEGTATVACTATVENNKSISSINETIRSDIRVGYYCTSCVVRNNYISNRGVSVDASSKCELSNNAPMTGLFQDENGVWYYYKNGVVDKSYTGLVAYSGSWYYVKNGKLDWGYCGFTQYYGTWYYVKNGKLDWSYTGIAQHTDKNWYYAQKGVINWKYTGFTQYYGTWYYVKNGKLDWSYTGIAQHTDKNWYYVQKGVINWKYNGFSKYYGSWYYIKNGKLDWSYTGVAQHTDKNWYYAQKGVINWNYTGLCAYAGSLYYVQGGKINWGYSGYVKYTDGKTYRVVNGKAQ